MTYTIVSCPEWIRVLFALNSQIVCLVAMATLIFALQQKRMLRTVYVLLVIPYDYLFAILGIVATDTCRTGYIPPAIDRDGLFCYLAEWFCTVDFYYLVALSLSLVVLHVIFVYFTVRWYKFNLSILSVKESLDELPMGLCYYRGNGQVFLINRSMEILGRLLTGESVQNGKVFYERLVRADINPGCTALKTETEFPVVCFQDGSIYTFVRRKFGMYGNRDIVWELSAVDHTEEYHLNESLRKKNEQLRRMNERMRHFSEEVTATTISREVLSAKIRIHNEFGAVLVASRRYLNGTAGFIRRDSLLERWRKNLRLLQNSGEETVSDEYELLAKTAVDIGVKLNITGVLPEKGYSMKVASTAIHECLTNTIRHGGGDELNVNVSTGDGLTVITLMNNGCPSEGEIVPSGGLKSLKNLVESVGGKFEAKGTPVFTVKITLRQEETDGQIQSNDRG